MMAKDAIAAYLSNPDFDGKQRLGWNERAEDGGKRLFIYVRLIVGGARVYGQCVGCRGV